MVSLFLILISCNTNVVSQENNIVNSLSTESTRFILNDPTPIPTQPKAASSPLQDPTVTSSPEFVISTQTDHTGQVWTKYTNNKYGFMVEFPQDWEVSEKLTTSLESNFLILSPKADHDVQLILGFKSADEKSRIERTGIPAGDLISKGTLDILGQEVKRNVLVYEGKTKAVLYDNGMGIKINGLIFTINLGMDSSGIGYDAVNISLAFQEAAEEIIKTIERLSKKGSVVPF